ncbi:hypothetical protein MSEO_01510 [Mycobacterium seoulense]|uniref:Uncharacterized protein n=1 Tax=Mycobacterium seoulense TaxID=386911 RepID=A0A7I7NUY2_9MYCO|nr:hypothetical protein MSEO_01510 [Mycobacterium seoulense]
MADAPSVIGTAGGLTAVGQPRAEHGQSPFGFFGEALVTPFERAGTHPLVASITTSDYPPQW